MSAPSLSLYGFSDRLPAEFPLQIIVDITEVCNLACVHCPHPQFRRSEHYAARYLDPVLNAKMVSEVRDHGQGKTRYLRYTSNGEPLLHPKGYDLIEDAVRRSGVFVTLTTNGTIMNEKRTRRLLESGLHMVDVSIDAFRPETYAAIRVNGDLSVTRTNVLRLIDWARREGGETRVVVSYVEQPKNRDETDAFEKYWKEQGADFVVVRRMHSHSGAKEQVASSMRAAQIGRERRPCLYPWERILLNAKGELGFCPSDWVHGSILANYAETTILETWRGEFYRRLREAHQCNNFGNFSFCGQCPDWEVTRWPDEDRSYADMVMDFQAEDRERRGSDDT